MSVVVRSFRSGGWEVDIRLSLANGKPFRFRKKAPVASKSAAQKWGEATERDIIAKLGHLAPGDPTPSVRKEAPKLQDFATRFIDGYAVANRLKPSGIEAKRQVLRVHLIPQLGSKPLDGIRNEDVQKLKAALSQRSPKTVNNILTTLNKLLKVAVEWGVIPDLPCRIKLLKVPKGQSHFVDFHEYARLVDAAEKVDPRIHIMVLLGGDAGLRRGEIIALCWEDIDFQRRLITVRRSVWNGFETTPKGGKPRVVNMTEMLAEALQAHRHIRGKRVLYNDRGTETTAKDLRRWMEQAVKRACLPLTGGVHILRHTFCSHLAMRGAPAKAIQELAGHEDLSTTLRYMHLSPDARRSAIELLDQVRREPMHAAGSEAQLG